MDRSRWVLYQAQPAWALSNELRSMLEQAPPRLIRDPGQRYARSTTVDDYAHEMYRVHRIFPRPFWVLQGRQGGVPAGYTEIEQRILKEMGEPVDAPPVGALPYCGFDWRVCEQILMRDKLLAADMTVDDITDPSRILNGVRTEEAEGAQDGRRAFVEWFKGTLAPGADFLTWYTRRSESDMQLRKATRGEMVAAREAEDTYIETGQVPVIREVA